MARFRTLANMMNMSKNVGKNSKTWGDYFKGMGDLYSHYPGATIGTLADLAALGIFAGSHGKAETPEENASFAAMLGTGIGAGAVETFDDMADKIQKANRKTRLLKTLLGGGVGALGGAGLGYLIGGSDD